MLHRQHILMENLPRIRADEVNAQYLSSPSARDDFGETARLAFSDCPIHIRLWQCEDINIAIFFARFCLSQAASRYLRFAKRRPRHNRIVNCFGEREEDIPQKQLRLIGGDVREEIMSDNIARGIDVLYARLQFVVHFNPAFVDVHAELRKS